jgi:parallel beta-helix repeat protein
MTKTKALFSAFLVFLMISGLGFVGNVHFGRAQNGTDVSGIINSNTIWNQASSPYILIGNVLVNNSVSLIIQEGVMVNFNGYYLRVNGTLHVQGTPSNNIVFNIPNGAGSGDSAIEFESSSQGWNDTTKSGSIIENTFITSTWELYPTILIDSVSPKINNNTIYCTNELNNNDAINVEGTATPTISNNTIEGQITANGGTISNNTIVGARLAGIWLTGNTTAYGNTVYGCEKGILATSSNENYYSSTLIVGNLIFNNTRGMELEIYSYGYYPRSIITQNNTVSNNTDGIMISSDSGPATYSILNNNIYDNKDYDFLLAGNINQDINATYNWWGTNDSQAIGPKIWDFKYNFNLGTVNFVPFLKSINSQAPIYNPNAYGLPPMPTSTPTQTPTVTPTPPPTTPPPSPTASPAPSTSSTSTPTPPPSTTPTSNPTPNPTSLPSLKATRVSISIDASSSTVGSSVNINGKLTDSTGKPLTNKIITLSYTLPGSSNSIPIGSDTTSSAGDYSLQWVNTASGIFTLKVDWIGDTVYQASSNTTTLSFLPYQKQNVFLVESNSTITELAFNSTSSEFSFNVNGPSGTTGYVKTTIAKNLMTNPENTKVYLDGNQLNYTITSNADSWQLTFNYSHSTHSVSIMLKTESTIPELSTWVIISLISIATLSLIVLKKKQSRRLQRFQ